MNSTIPLQVSVGGLLRREGNNAKIEARFHRRAGSYDHFAVVQKHVVEQLIRLAEAHCSTPPRTALDIGCGTGTALLALHELYPAARLSGLDPAPNMLMRSAERLGANAVLVKGDAEFLPFGDGTFDLVVSSSTFQWVQRLDICLRECRRVLKSGGLFCAAFFGGRTLWELQESYREALTVSFCVGDRRCSRLQRFRGIDEVKAMLSLAGFDQALVTMETEVEYHPDVPALLRSIRNIGATTPANNEGSGLGWRGVLNAMSDIYRSRFQTNGMIPATYDVIYFVARLSS